MSAPTNAFNGQELQTAKKPIYQTNIQQVGGRARFTICHRAGDFRRHNIMTRSIVLIATILTITVFSLTTFQTTMASGHEDEFFLLKHLKPGMKGRGRTIFQGTKIEEFDCEIIGVLENISPGQNLILARLQGGPLKETGVYAGMSGSPVYIDGKLLGAVAFSIPFSKEPIAGITPIEEMLNIFEEKPAGKATPKVYINKLNTKESLYLPQSPTREFKIPNLESAQPTRFPAALTGQTLMPIATPITFSGFSPSALERFAPQLQGLGLTPVFGSAAAAPADSGPDTPLQPGSNISVQLAQGDLNISASGTTTYVKGDKIYAFGHPFLGIGFTELPLNKGQVLAVLPNLLTSSGVAASIKPIGMIKQDRATGILGVLGQKPRMVPVSINLHTSRNVDKTFNYEVVRDRFLTPLLMNLTIYNIIVSSERALGGSTLQVKGSIKIKDHPEVNIEDIFSAKVNSPAFASKAVAAPVYYLLSSGFNNLEMEGIRLNIASVEEERDAVLERVWYDKTKVAPGEEVNITVFLKRENGDEVTETYPIKIPESIAPGLLSILISDGDSLAMMDAREIPGGFIPENLNQLIKAINNLKKSNRLYVRMFRRGRGVIVKGEDLPSLPPSILSIFDSKRSKGGILPTHLSTFMEYELPPAEYVISGQKVIEIEVVPG